MTFSIVALDAAAGQVALGVQSHVLAVGRGVHHIAPGVGAVASQAAGLYAHGTRILDEMRSGTSPATALEESLAKDDASSTRQVIAIDTSGATAAHTGRDCIRFAGHHRGRNHAVAGNILEGDGVLQAMVDAGAAGFDSSDTGPSLAQRVMTVLMAAQDAGGDQRGRQSASLLVVGPQDTGDLWADHIVDVRVDDHPDPLAELGRLVTLAETHHGFEQAEIALLDGRAEEAMAMYEHALARHDAAEFHVWAAIAMVEADEPEQACELIARLHGRPDASRWRELTTRLAEAEMVAPEVVATWW